MRELFFRGKRVDNGEWFEGDGIQFPKSDKRKGTCWIGGMQTNSDSYWAEVVPETVGQYTGVTDKNGKKYLRGILLDTKPTNVLIFSL